MKVLQNLASSPSASCVPGHNIVTCHQLSIMYNRSRCRSRELNSTDLFLDSPEIFIERVFSNSGILLPVAIITQSVLGLLCFEVGPALGTQEMFAAARQEADREEMFDHDTAERETGNDDGDADFDHGPDLCVVVFECDVLEVDIHDIGDADDGNNNVAMCVVSRNEPEPNGVASPPRILI